MGVLRVHNSRTRGNHLVHDMKRDDDDIPRGGDNSRFVFGIDEKGSLP